MVTVDNDGAKQAVFRSVDEIFNVRRARTVCGDKQILINPVIDYLGQRYP